MKIEDVLHLISFRRRHFPHLERQVRDLDGIASVAMVSGLIAYGWKVDELSACQGLVAKNLRKHADSSRLSHRQLRGSQSEGRDDNRDNYVGADDIVLPISNEAEWLSTLGSVALDSSVSPSPCVDYVNQPLQLSPLEHICRKEPPTSGTPSKDVNSKSALGKESPFKPCRQLAGNRAEFPFSETRLICIQMKLEIQRRPT